MPGNYLFKEIIYLVLILDQHTTIVWYLQVIVLFLDFLDKLMVRQNTLFSTFYLSVFLQLVSFLRNFKVPLKKRRSRGQKVILFLDDGLGGDVSYDKALLSSRYIRQDLIDFGFLIADEKCQWIPSQIIVRLGYLWNSKSGKLQITNEQICKAGSLLDELITKVTSGNVILPVRKIALIIGQLISMQSVIGHLV